ncbi:MAG: hypothetical protein HY363_00410 [Candidatus Aenigmarchaeota archaeon]|nr:hypothetical protein [Candidatus Aenigmarchaeota archaeon]
MTELTDSSESYVPSSLGIGLCFDPCYICAENINEGHAELVYGMSAAVENRDVGDRIVNMYLEQELYAEFHPCDVQVKIGACRKHMKNLMLLEKLVTEAENKINPNIIKQSVQEENELDTL